MRDYNIYLPHHREHQRRNEARMIDGVSAVLSMLLLVGMIGLVCFSCADAVDVELQNQALYYRQPVARTFVRPAAYRLATPTADQMEATEALLQIQPLVRR